MIDQITKAILIIRQQCLSVNENDIVDIEEFVEQVDEQLSVICQCLTEIQKPKKLR